MLGHTLMTLLWHPRTQQTFLLAKGEDVDPLSDDIGLPFWTIHLPIQSKGDNQLSRSLASTTVLTKGPWHMAWLLQRRKSTQMLACFLDNHAEF